MLKSLKFKLLVTVSTIVVFTILTIMLFVQNAVEDSIFHAQDQNAKNLLHSTLLTVENQYKSLLFHREASLKKRKSELKSVLTIALSYLDSFHQSAKEGKLTEREAKAHAIRAIKEIRYNHGVGYIWINDIQRPIPNMIMHPTISRLDGTNLNDPNFNCALGNNTNLFKAIVNVCLDEGQGFVDYLWPKPTVEGLTTKQPKLSYVELFEEWNWILGTGLYIDDIDKDLQERRNAILEELNHTFSQIKVAQSGYMYLFTGNQDMLIHPSLVGADFSKLLNPKTQNPILEDLMLAEKTPGRMLDYLWDKPPHHKGQFEFWKRSYIAYFEPLDWYIASSVYLDENKLPAAAMQRKILYLSVAILSLAIVLSLVFANSLTKPLQRLAAAAKKIKQDGIDKAKIPISGTIETRELGSVLDQMIKSIDIAVKEKEGLVQALESSNQDMVRTNTQLQEEVRIRKLTEAELMKARNRAEAANKIKSEFIANMSHEIRTPLNAITGFSDLLNALVEDDKQKRYLKAIQTAGQSLLTLINDILDLSKVEAGKLEIQYAPMNPRKVLSDIEQIFKLKADSKKLTFFIEIDESVPSQIVLDKARLRQVLLNLVGNAVKFTQRGSVKIHTWSEPHADARNRVDLIFSVKDTGMGIPLHEQKTIFEAFKQQEGQDANEFGGTGLGLAISRKLTLMMKGEISVQSVEGEGSEFMLKLRDVKVPDRIVDEDEEPSANVNHIQFENGKVLIADDVASNRLLLEELLHQCDLEVLSAENGEQAVCIAIEQQPNVILMDLQMPVMNGIAATVCLKETEQTSAIPVIALTATKIDNEDQLSNVFDDVLFKPIRINALIDSLKNHLNWSEPQQLTDETATEAGFDLEEINNLDALIETIDTDIVPRAESLIGVMNMVKISTFTQAVIELGKKHNAQYLIEYGNEIEILKEAFDVEGLERSLAGFQDLLEELKELNNGVCR